MDIRRHIPNTLTCLNLLSGAIAVVLATVLADRVPWHCALGMLVLAAFFDLLDGLVARALGATSPIGKDLDSLADVISFGLAPAVLLYSQLQNFVGLGEDSASVYRAFLFALPALLIAVFAALRLARFNNDTRQSTSFIGLPVPSAALFVIGILPDVGLLGLLGSLARQVVEPIHVPCFVMSIYYVLIALVCYMMVSPIPMFSFKLKGAKLSSLWPQISLVTVAVVSVFTLGWIGFSITIVAYVLLSYIQSRCSAEA